MQEVLYKQAKLQVALLAEGVDRNIFKSWKKGKMRAVALLAEGVDRNLR